MLLILKGVIADGVLANHSSIQLSYGHCMKLIRGKVCMVSLAALPSSISMLLSNRESTVDVNKTPHEQHEMKRPGYSFERPGRRVLSCIDSNRVHFSECLSKLGQRTFIIVCSPLSSPTCRG
jgi:hypothetical protein